MTNNLKRKVKRKANREETKTRITSELFTTKAAWWQRNRPMLRFTGISSCPPLDFFSIIISRPPLSLLPAPFGGFPRIHPLVAVATPFGFSGVEAPESQVGRENIVKENGEAMLKQN